MGNRINTQVLIVGGGPVGLTLAIDLAQRGIHVTVAETRAGGEAPSVKCNHVASRTMEIFRGSSGLVAAHLPKVQNRRNPAGDVGCVTKSPSRERAYSRYPRSV